MAGPVYRCRKTLIVLNQGKIPERIHLRTGDFFQELAEEINRQTDLCANEARRREEITRQINELSASNISADVKAKVDALKNWI